MSVGNEHIELNRAMALHEDNRLDDAEAIYQRLLHGDSAIPEAWHFAGILDLQRGNAGRAAERIATAAKLAPEDADIQANLGNARLAAGEPGRAVDAFSEATRLAGGDPDNWYGLGRARQALGQARAAEQAYSRALRIRPDDADACLGRGEVRLALDDASGAKIDFNRALEGGAPGRDARLGLAKAMHGLGDDGSARRLLAENLKENRNDHLSLHALGQVDLTTGDPAAAADSFARCVAARNGFLDGWLDLGRARLALGESSDAVTALRRAFAISGDDARVAMALAQAYHQVVYTDYRAGVAGELTALLRHDAYAQQIARACGAQIYARHAGIVDDRRWLTGLAADPLVMAYLVRVVNDHAELETLLVRARAALLQSAPEALAREPALAELALALACQCTLNEFVWPESAADALALDAVLRGREAADPAALLIASMFRQMRDLTDSATLSQLEGRAPAGFARLRKLAFDDPGIERELAARIPSVSAIDNRISRAVARQYEDNPYPRWRTLPVARREPLSAMLARRFPWYAPDPGLDGAIQVLVAGCGTGQEPAAIAQSRPEARICAVDLSRASLAYAVRQCRELGLGHIEFLHGDILNLGDLGREFDVIESSGVLHHLDEPLAGLKVLASLLRPGGVMKLALYSAIARAPVALARDWVARSGLSPDSAGIRAARDRILSAGPEDALRALRHSEDLFTTSSARDLLFHVREHGFTVPGIADFVTAAGLQIIGIEFPDASIRRQFQRDYPGAQTARDLDNWAEFERRNPQSFSGMYRFWCEKPGLNDAESTQ